ncbi:arabinose transporter [Burkholderia glumae]|nr:arabinose transporter [Burkholderia glumae]MCM2484478.1 arabinose transporter [Burkholderia glumae]MCM2510170.1 arabinose transporter [Burkholderia glumae]MCM2539935.1 arabinose transporter [Burkholderia glumae]MCQ0031316.1 arabinose transporter [Burkholderia glumae]MCQ0036227.1 arabinose transporter [Burkholderia glumae]
MTPITRYLPMSTDLQDLATPHAAAARTARLICFGVFLGALTFGLLLPVVPLYVHDTLGFGTLVVGAAVGAQFLATVLTRSIAGRRADHHGAKPTMCAGLVSCAIAGGVYVASAAAPAGPGTRLALLVAARLLSGFGESQLATGALAWGIGTLGANRAGRVLSWTGMALYGAIAIGAPCGMALARAGGLTVVAAATIALPCLALAVVATLPGVATQQGRRVPLARVLRLIAPPGCSLALQGVGFAAIGAFVTLLFQARRWDGAGLALSCFGGAFVLVRVLFGHLPDRFGGYPVALAALLVEAIGQLLLWAAPVSGLALVGAAVSGLGSSLVFPALGVATLRHVPAQARGTALGGFTAFQDVAYACTGPLAGWVVARTDYPSAFAIGAGAAFAGVLLTAWLMHADRSPR